MTLEQYKARIQETLEATDWMHLRDKDGPAYQLLVEASKDKELRTEEWQQLADQYYGYQKS